MAGGSGIDGASGWGLEMTPRQLAITGGISLLALLLLAFCVVLPGDDDTLPSDETTPASGTPTADSGTASSTPAADATQPSVTATTAVASDADARSMRVGDLELEVIGVLHPYDASQHAGLNTANTRIDLEATAVGDGGAYFTAFELALMDDAGDEHRGASCLDCPGNLDSLELGADESGAGSAYFELPEGREPYELIYRSSAAGEEGRIPLR